MTTDLDSTGRFSDRVAAYEKARPSYPDLLYSELLSALDEGRRSVVELGSGTGIFTAELLRRGCLVYAVEPNPSMRAAAEGRLSSQPHYRSVAGTAESTGLGADCADLVVSAQAFHWFDFHRARIEVERILRTDGVVAWVWNSRRTEGSPFAEAVERFLVRWGTDYIAVRETYRVRERLARFFPEAKLHRSAFPNHQILDRATFRARILSASYMPSPEDERHQAMLAALDALFEEHRTEDCVRLELDAELFWTHRG
ncbi:MAG: class I SAM-dependent methyltransferase [Thermoanaerobaculia bacterium]